MLRGYIENVTEETVDGWVYCQARSLTGMTILAFDGSTCIGSGEVNIYRPDLAEAGLGDGQNGFSIYCGKDAIQKAQHINIRLIDSDFLIQTAIKPPTAAPHPLRSLLPFSPEEDKRLTWMAAQGWMNQAQFALARALNSTGHYVRTLSRVEISGTSPESILSHLITDTLSMMFRRDYPNYHAVTISSADLKSELDSVKNLPVDERFVAIFGATHECTLTDGAVKPDGEASAHGKSTHKLTPFQALIFHADCFDAIHTSKASELSLLRIQG